MQTDPANELTNWNDAIQQISKANADKRMEWGKPEEDLPAQSQTAAAALRFRIGAISAHLARMQSNCLEMLVDITLAGEQDRLRWLTEDMEKLGKRVQTARDTQAAMEASDAN